MRGALAFFFLLIVNCRQQEPVPREFISCDEAGRGAFIVDGRRMPCEVRP